MTVSVGAASFLFVTLRSIDSALADGLSREPCLMVFREQGARPFTASDIDRVCAMLSDMGHSWRRVFKMSADSGRVSGMVRLEPARVCHRLFPPPLLRARKNAPEEINFIFINQ